MTGAPYLDGLDGVPEGNAPAAPSAPVVFIDWSEFWAKDRSESEWVVEPILARGRGHAIWAKGGEGKSEFALDLVLKAVAAGYLVLYLDYEMSEADLYDRLVDAGCDETSDLALLRYAQMPALSPLDGATGAAELAETVDGVRMAHPGAHIVVVIDTFGRAVAGQEDSNDTIREFFRHAGGVMRSRGVTWCRLDHTGHAEEHARGASGKRDDVDVDWQLKRTDGGCKLRATKRRMSWVPESVSFTRRESPSVSYDPAPVSYPLGTMEVAEILERLSVPVEASTRGAQQALKESGQGRQRKVVVAAQKWRQQRAGTTPGTTSTQNDGNHSGTTTQESHNHGQEPLREPPGTIPPGRLGTTGFPIEGTRGPATRPEAATGGGES